MEVVRKPRRVHNIVCEARNNGSKIGFVPTMGAFHEGHTSLIDSAREKCDLLVVSIFVNPKQFGRGEDLSNYPRNFERDRKIACDHGCDILFAPGDRDIYSSNDRTRISVEKLSDSLCGLSRPGHFNGVVLIVAKLFNIIQPDIALFGQKDAQQAVIIQRMAYDLDFPVRILLGKTIREKSGLAMSSRNKYLSDEERKRATAMYHSLTEALGKLKAGSRDAGKLRSVISKGMEEAGFRVDYADIVEAATMSPWSGGDDVVLLAAAGWVGKARLIDNIAAKICGDKVDEVLLEFPGWSRYEE